MNSGVVALRIAAKPLSIWVWPQVISVKGRTLLSRPMMNSARQVAKSPGKRRPEPWTRMVSAAAGATRSSTADTGSMASSMISTK